MPNETPLIFIAIILAAAAIVFGLKRRRDNKTLAPTPNANGIYPGPIIKGKNYSRNVQIEHAPDDMLWRGTLGTDSELDGLLGPFEIEPGCMIRVRYRITGDPLVPTEKPGEPILSLFVARKGLDWTMKGREIYNRVYTTAPMPLTAGEPHEVVADALASDWHFVNGMGCADRRDLKNPDNDSVIQFYETIVQAALVGFGFGYRGGRQHGVRSTGKTMIEIIAWEVL